MAGPWAVGEVRVSVAIMHHPARAGLVGELVDQCRPLAARIVPDPDPGGFRSPLRTAKVAWASIAPGATHHLVLQDDARVCAGFAQHLAEAVAQRPEHGIALSTDWLSPQNGYLSRLAATVGAPWAPLSPIEWVPALAFLLPVGRAAELAAYLAPIPDEVTDDDQMMARFCRERGVPLVATLPHLVDCRELPSLTTGHGGIHHAAVWAEPLLLPPGHWVADPRVDSTLAGRSRYRHHDEYVVQLKDSRCLIRLLRPRTGEPGGNEFCWYWHDWCDLVGLSRVELVDDLIAWTAAQAPRRQAVPARLAGDVWAAGYLLGDAAAAMRDEMPVGLAAASEQRIRAAVASWVGSGLTVLDRALLDPADREDLINLGVAGVRHGLRRHDRRPLAAAGAALGEDTHDDPRHDT